MSSYTLGKLHVALQLTDACPLLVELAMWLLRLALLAVGGVLNMSSSLPPRLKSPPPRT